MTEMGPTVSILMPAKDCEKWIDDAIASVVDQRLREWELIIVDDGSADHTLDSACIWAGRLASEGPERIRVFHQQPSDGIALTLNRAGAKAKGRLLMFMGADDYIGPKFLQNAVQALEVFPEVTVACPPVSEFARFITDDLGSWWPPFNLERLHEENCIPGPSVFRRALFDAVPWPSGFEDGGCEDWARWVLLNRAGLLKPIRMWQPYYHRIREGGLSNNLATNLPSIRAKIRQLHEAGALTVAPTPIGEVAA